MNTPASSLQVHRKWRDGPDLLIRARRLVAYGPGDNRSTGYIYTDGEMGWPHLFAEVGPQLLDGLEWLLGVRFETVAYQAYLNGSGCDWHTDSPFDAQAVLSLGVTRTFGVRQAGKEPEWMQVAHGDLVVMPSGFQRDWEHCVPVEDIRGERISLVFRTIARS